MSISYPAWFLIFCPLAGALYALLFYYRDHKTSEFHLALRSVLTVLRFAAVTIAVFLLLSPLIRNKENTTEKPIVVVLQDNSASILASSDSTFYKTEYKNVWTQTIERLSAKYDVRTLSFGGELHDSMNYRFNQKETDIATALAEVNKRYYGKNLGAVILATDGIYNKGTDPVYAAKPFKCPIYTVAMGDTLVKRDAIVSRVEHNNTAFLGNRFPLLVALDARKLEGKSSVLTVTDATGGKDNKLFVKPVTFTSPNFHLDVPVQLDAKTAGLKHYIVKVDPVAGEENLQNNRQDIYINILDRKEKILILSTPHPDVAAIAETINGSDGFEAETILPEKFTGALNKYSLVILNQLPSASDHITQILNSVEQLGVPAIYILGSNSDINAFNQLKTGIRIQAMGFKTTEAEAAPVPGFSLFILNDEFNSYMGRCPALATPFANYQVSPSVICLCTQKIQNTATTYPLIAFNTVGTVKKCVIAGEGIFRWKLQDYADHKNHDFFDGLIMKIIQYLALKEDKSFFRVHAPNSYRDNEPVEMDAELYNPSYQLINDPEVSITITDESGKNYAYTFSRTTNAYHLNAGMLQAGVYSYAAQVKAGEQLYTKKGEFSITPVQIETAQTIADHQLLNNIASAHDGKMVFPRQIEQLADLIEKREDIKPVIYSHTTNSPIIDFKWLCVLILVLLSTEWFIRKWNGTY